MSRLLNKLLGRPAPPRAPTVHNPGLPTVAALVQATALPPTIKAALLDPAAGLKPESAPAAIKAAATMLDLAAARYRGDRTRALPAVAGFIRARSDVEGARAALMTDRDESDDIESSTSQPQGKTAPSNSNETYQRRKQGK